MLPATPAPNLYGYFLVDSRSTSRELSVKLAAADIQLANTGYLPEDQRRQELDIASKILCEPSMRASYDQEIERGFQPTWAQLEQVAETGRWPQQAPQPGYGGGPAGASAAFGASVPVAASAHPERASGGVRVRMAILDFVLASIVASLFGAATTPTSADGGTLAAFVMAVVVVAYFVGFEVILGATPGKMLFGYTVRNATTHDKLTWGQSIQRNWWRVAGLVPAVGPLLSLLAGLYLVTTIGPNTQLQGKQDRMVNAEVAKK